MRVCHGRSSMLQYARGSACFSWLASITTEVKSFFLAVRVSCRSLPLPLPCLRNICKRSSRPHYTLRVQVKVDSFSCSRPTTFGERLRTDSPPSCLLTPGAVNCFFFFIILVSHTLSSRFQIFPPRFFSYYFDLLAHWSFFFRDPG